jgi:predicted ATPase
LPARRYGAAVTEPFLRSLVLDRDAIDDPTAYPFSIPAIARLTELDFNPHVTFLARANGPESQR